MYNVFCLLQEQCSKPLQVNAEEWEKFSNTRFCQHVRDKYASKIHSKDAFKGEGTKELELGRADITRTKSHHFVCIESIENEMKNIFLIQEEETDQANDSVLLFSGECKTSGLQLESLLDFFNEQIEADEKAFKRGIIQDPIYEMLLIVSKFIGNRKKAFTIKFTGKRCIVYHNEMTEHVITVNPKDGWFMLDNSETKYNEYIPTMSKTNLILEFQRKQLFKSADSLNNDLSTVFNSDVINETWHDCELTIYSGRNEINILCGRGEEGQNRKIINQCGDKITVQENPIKIAQLT